MRYLTLTYVTRANGKVDEVMAVVRNIKRSDLQMCNVILVEMSNPRITRNPFSI